MKSGKKGAETPMMQQFNLFKAQHPEAVLLFRVGDFYETYGEDAVIASKVLGLVLTKRSNASANSVEMAGFPHHSIESYLSKLVRAGYKVAVCDQLEDPKMTKKLVKRGITELVTPGIAYSDQLLEQKENNYLAALYFNGSERSGVAFLDISTGSFSIAEGNKDYLEVLLNDMAPKEILLQREYVKGFKEHFGEHWYISQMDEWAFNPIACREKLLKQLNVETLKGFGVEGMVNGITAAGSLLFYLESNFNAGVAHICSLKRIDRESFVWMDSFTFRNLEIFSSAAGKEGTTLLQVMDKSLSPQGGRLLRSWLAMPLKSKEEIERRQGVVQYFADFEQKREAVRELVSQVGDLERIVARAAAGKIMPKEVMQLLRGLSIMGPLKSLALEDGVEELATLAEGIETFENLRRIIGEQMMAEPASLFGKGDIIANGVDAELDDLRSIARHSKEYLLNLQQQESERSGITSLKVGYNNIFGYYLEVRNTHKDKVPAEWIRKQTLVNAERYITQELKEYEEKILGAEEKILAIEQRIYASIVAKIQQEIRAIQQSSAIVAQIDLLSAFAQLAVENNYSRPIIDQSLEIEIRQGRHPVIERNMPLGQEYVANDIKLDSQGEQIIILTGPNMAGKSALLRQTALIVLMAQTGSFVPAAYARIGIVDKVFTRVGASDNISKGESTFMVEMTETSTILHNLSPRSLVLLDEIGRGTSTFDGMSIAWAIVEYIHQNGQGAKTLFATHYHELNELEERYPRIKNYHIAVKEVGNSVIFLRKLLPGGVAHSFGIHVARMAGMPMQVVESAQRILAKLESERGEEAAKSLGRATRPESMQLTLFQLDDPLLLDIKDKLMKMDINTMSPLDAFDALRELKRQMGLKV
ncbi:MAG: DNA mismatch repair protein MutS [bacterium]|nr:DNA mismatch repair protein MutS [bacterium]MDD7235747.1 DNA mismatch repair protein MutS [bacterium]MDY2650232.1 DNA mismatch repair protein MutS [Candidatus Egerieousia sp.]MDY5023584.1 DNA mismatch repair protein MutS [Candidatus Egerieousia sp.]